MTTEQELINEIEELRQLIEFEFQDKFLTYADLKNVGNRYIQEKDFSEIMEKIIKKFKKTQIKGIQEGKKDINCQDCKCCKSTNYLCGACLSVFKSDVEKESYNQGIKDAEIKAKEKQETREHTYQVSLQCAREAYYELGIQKAIGECQSRFNMRTETLSLRSFEEAKEKLNQEIKEHD